MAAYHTAHFTKNPRRALVWKAIAGHLAPLVPAGAHVLEIGAGYCDWINNVTAARRIAIDVWPELPKFAAGGVEPIVMDVGHGLAGLGAGRFDVVLASNLLEHFSPDAAASVVGDVAGVLKPGGRFVIIQPNFRHASKQYFDDYTHRAVFTDVSLPALLRSKGFRIETVKARFLPYSMREARVPITPWLVKAYLLSPIKPLAGQMLVVASKDA
jgi:SAM-dependent methyltransferase